MNRGLVGKRREERDGDIECLDLVVAAGGAIGEYGRAILDLDVVERSARHLDGLRHQGVDQVLDVVAALAVARQPDARTNDSQRVEHGRAMPDRGSGHVGHQFIEGKEGGRSLDAGHHELAQAEPQPEGIEGDGLERRGTVEKRAQAGLDLPAHEGRDGDPGDENQQAERADDVTRPSQPAVAAGGSLAFGSVGHYRQLGRRGGAALPASNSILDADSDSCRSHPPAHRRKQETSADSDTGSNCHERN